MNTFFYTFQKKDCNGCGACSLRCPQSAIRMVEDNEGFLYPKIDKYKCVQCGLCKSICSNNPNKKNETKTYIAINKNKDILMQSTSGGLFSVLSTYIINLGGKVFGVRYDKNLKVVHDSCDNIENLSNFRSSKYVRSDLKNSYQNIEKELKLGKYILFTGTPCQCAGLRAYLMRDYDKLITCEVICHANPSPLIFDMFKKNISKKYNDEIKEINFRNKKKYGWHSGEHTDILFKNGTEYDIPEYTLAFLKELINRPSCHNCRFCSSNRFSDFSIGDLWGVEKVSDIKDDNTGISLLCVNTPKAEKHFKNFKNNLIIHDIDSESAFKYNHNSNVKMHPNRKKFFELVKNGKINENNIIDSLKKYTKTPIYYRIINKIKKLNKKNTC